MKKIGSRFRNNVSVIIGMAHLMFGSGGIRLLETISDFNTTRRDPAAS